MSKRGHVGWEAVAETGRTQYSEHHVNSQEHTIAVLSCGVVKDGLRALWLHEKAACFHTLTSPTRRTYPRSQSFQPQEAFIPTAKPTLIFFVTTKADGLICIQV